MNSSSDSVSEVAGELGPPPNIRYQHVVNISFTSQSPFHIITGIRDLATLKKFNRLVQSLEQRAREHQLDRQQIFHSLENLLRVLQLTKNSREFRDATQ